MMQGWGVCEWKEVAISFGLRGTARCTQELNLAALGA